MGMDTTNLAVSDPSDEITSTANSGETFKLDLMDKHTMSLQHAKDLNSVLEQLKNDPSSKDRYIYGLDGIFEALNRRYNKKSTFWQTEKLDAEAFRRKLLEENH